LKRWLRAGVMEQGCIYHPEAGTPQGGVIFPLLANVLLHEVLLEDEADARRVLAVLPERFGRYSLRLHPAKTRLVPFQRPRAQKSARRPGTFDLLGFTHYWGRSRKGNWVVKRKTARSRFSRMLRHINAWCSKNLHLPVRQQHVELCRKLRGHDAYYGITPNFAALASLRYWVERIWRKWLSRRSWDGRLSWEKMRRLLKVFPLSRPRVVHSALAHAAKP
jgi:RNA-directed DNA polymerase